MRTILLMFCLATMIGAEEQEQTECEICGATVYQTARNYVSGNTRYLSEAKREHHKRAAHSAFGAWPWVVAIVVAMFTIIRKLLK